MPRFLYITLFVIIGIILFLQFPSIYYDLNRSWSDIKEGVKDGFSES